MTSSQKEHPCLSFPTCELAKALKIESVDHLLEFTGKTTYATTYPETFSAKCPLAVLLPSIVVDCEEDHVGLLRLECVTD